MDTKATLYYYVKGKDEGNPLGFIAVDKTSNIGMISNMIYENNKLFFERRAIDRGDLLLYAVSRHHHLICALSSSYESRPTYKRNQRKTFDNASMTLLNPYHISVFSAKSRTSLKKLARVMAWSI